SATGFVPNLDRLTPFDRLLIAALARALGDAPLRLALWDGTEVGGNGAHTGPRLQIRSRRALLRLSMHPQLYFGECYGEGSIDVDGNFADAMTTLFRATGQARGPYVAIDRVHAHLHRNDPARSLHNVHHH